MTVREEPSPLTGGPRRRPGRRHRPRRSDPRRASRAWRRAPAQKQHPHRRTTSGRGGQGPDRPGAVRRRPSAAPEDRRDAITGWRHPRTVPPRSDPAGGEGGRPAPRSGGGRERSRFAPPARGQGRLEVAGPLPADGGSAVVFAADPAKHRPAPGRRRSRERASGADSARGATPPRPERATEHREAAVDDPAPPRPAIRALQDGVFTSSRGGHRPHRAPGICTGTARPRRSSFLFIKTTNPGCQVWSERGTKHKHASTAIFPQVPSRSRRERSARHRPFGPPVQSAHIESGTARRPGLRLLRACLARQRRRRDRDDPIDGLTTRR